MIMCPSWAHSGFLYESPQHLGSIKNIKFHECASYIIVPLWVGTMHAYKMILTNRLLVLFIIRLLYLLLVIIVTRPTPPFVNKTQ